MKEITKKFDVSQYGLKCGHVQTDAIGNAILPEVTVLSYNAFIGRYFVEIPNGSFREFKHLEDARRQFKLTTKVRRNSTALGRALKMQNCRIIEASKNFKQAERFIVVCEKQKRWTNVKIFSVNDGTSYDITLLLTLFNRRLYLDITASVLKEISEKWCLTSAESIRCFINEFIDAMQHALLYNVSHAKINYVWL